MKQTIKQRNAYREMVIGFAVKHNYSANKTQKLLKKHYVGIRRTSLLVKIRVRKEIQKKQDVSKYIPKKYRKYGGGGYRKGGFGDSGKQIKLYRVSIAIKN